MTYGNRSFTGSLIQPLVNPTGSVPLYPFPSTVVGGTEFFYMDVGGAQAGSFQVNVQAIGTAASTFTVTQSSGVNTTTGVLTIASGTTWDGNLVQATSSGTLPTGIAGSTNYYVFQISSTTIQLFSSLASALQAVATYGNSAAPVGTTGLVVPSAVGSGTLTLTPTALGTTTYSIQGSNDFVPSPNVVGNGNTSSTGVPTALNVGNWVTLATGESPAGSVTNTITTTGSSALVFWYPLFKYYRILFSVAAGTAQIQVLGHNA